jgi:hypothetical protein
MLQAYDDQLRARVPADPPIGAAYVADGEVVRVHYGTHGVVEHQPFASVDVRRQQDAFAERGEPVEWKVYGHDSPDLPAALIEAGFSAGWRRRLLIAPIEALRSEISAAVQPLRLEPDPEVRQRAAQQAAEGGPHRVELSELEADGMMVDELSTLFLRDGRHIDAVGWAHHLDGTEFIELGGMTRPVPEFLAYWAGWSRFGPQRRLAWPSPEARFLVAEADGALRDMLIAAGFEDVSVVQSYHWTPSTPPAATRPVQQLLYEAEYREMWDRVYAQLSFSPDVREFPGIQEPVPSVTWPLGPSESLVDKLTEPFRRTLPIVAPTEDLYWLDWNHVGYRFDPRRVGGEAQPDWPGAAYPDGDYYLYVTRDLRLGTFGHPFEQTLCVFGAELLAEVEPELTDLLGRPVRNSWRRM